jgi:hypothetical protein
VHEKSLRLPQLRTAANHSISYAWKTTRAEIHPQILLKSLISLDNVEAWQSAIGSAPPIQVEGCRQLPAQPRGG